LEKRRLSRVQFEQEAEVRLNNEVVKGNVLNLSLNGMFFSTKKKLEINKEVEIIIYLTATTSSLTINVKGLIVRTSDKGSGIQFTDVDIDSFILLKNIVEYNEEQPKKIMKEFYKFLKKRKKQNL